jgi:hypothetical protein
VKKEKSRVLNWSGESMSRKDIIRKLVRAFENSGKSAENRQGREAAPSDADITATLYMQRVLQGQKRCARELQGFGFEG